MKIKVQLQENKLIKVNQIHWTDISTKRVVSVYFFVWFSFPLHFLVFFFIFFLRNRYHFCCDAIFGVFVVIYQHLLLYMVLLLWINKINFVKLITIDLYTELNKLCKFIKNSLHTIVFFNMAKSVKSVQC